MNIDTVLSWADTIFVMCLVGKLLGLFLEWIKTIAFGKGVYGIVFCCESLGLDKIGLGLILQYMNLKRQHYVVFY